MDSFNNLTGQAHCQPCPRGGHTLTVGSISQLNCTASSASLTLAYGAAGGAGIIIVLVLVILLVIILIRRRRRPTNSTHGPAKQNQVYEKHQIKGFADRDVVVDNPVFATDEAANDEFERAAAYVSGGGADEGAYGQLPGLHNPAYAWGEDTNNQEDVCLIV